MAPAPTNDACTAFQLVDLTFMPTFCCTDSAACFPFMASSREAMPDLTAVWSPLPVAGPPTAQPLAYQMHCTQCSLFLPP